MEERFIEVLSTTNGHNPELVRRINYIFNDHACKESFEQNQVYTQKGKV